MTSLKSDRAARDQEGPGRPVATPVRRSERRDPEAVHQYLDGRPAAAPRHIIRELAAPGGLKAPARPDPAALGNPDVLVAGVESGYLAHSQIDALIFAAAIQIDLGLSAQNPQSVEGAEELGRTGRKIQRRFRGGKEDQGRHRASPPAAGDGRHVDPLLRT